MTTQTLLLNTVNFAGTQLLQHFANSLAVFNGELLVANSSGLHISDEASTEHITAFVEFPRSDLGYPGYKTPRAILLGCVCDGVISVSITDENGITKEYYTKVLEGEDGCKIGLDSNQRSRYFIVKVANVSGSYFSLSSVAMIFIPGPERTVLP